MHQTNILLIEDETIISMDIERILNLKNFNNITILRSGEDAVQFIEKNTPDLIIMDIILAGKLDGISTMELIKLKKDIPFIYMTAHTDEMTINRAKATEPYGFIIKPINKYELLSAIEIALHKHEINKKLLINEARYRGLFNNSKNCVAIYKAVEDGKDFIFVDFNNAAEKVEKIKKEKILGKSILEIFPGAKEFGIFDTLKKVWKSGQAIQFPIKFYKDNRISGWRDNYIYKLPSEEIVAIYTDETDLKITKNSLLENENFFEKFFNYANMGFAISTAQKKFLKVNSQLCKMLGYSEKELIKKTWEEMTYPPDLDADTTQFERIITGEIKKYDLNKRFICKNNKIINTHSTVSCVKNKNCIDFIINTIDQVPTTKNNN